MQVHISFYGNYSINDPIQFTNTATGDVSMLWEFGDGTTYRIEPSTYLYQSERLCGNANSNLSVAFMSKITFIVERIFIGCSEHFYPNNDNINDTLRPVTKALKNVRLDIYDTWVR
jgi:hypothetical protein